MTYAKIDNNTVLEWPLADFEIKKRFPNTSFTSPFAPPEGYVKIADTPLPEHGDNFYCKEAAPVFIDGVLTRQWEVLPVSEEEIQNRNSQKEKSVRDLRNDKLAACDWTQLADAPVDSAVWGVYRQALRDVPSQAGFPWEIAWPEEP